MSRPEYHFYLNFWMGVHIGKPWVSFPVVMDGHYGMIHW